MIKPMLCKGQDKPFVDEKFIWEQKYDGARIIAVVLDGKVRLFSRSGKEKTSMFPDIKVETKTDAILDGEIISGKSFNDLQHRVNRQNGIAQSAKDYPAKYVVFDVLEFGGINVRSQPLGKRKEILTTTLVETNNVSLAPYVRDGVALFDIMAEHGLEGIIGKSLSSLYHENRREWLKVKCWQMGTFLVVGYTKGTGWREQLFGAMVLSDLHGNYVGSVGTGFDDAQIQELMGCFYSGSCPWTREPEPATWVIPFGVKVQYLEYTNDGKLRFPSFKGLITDTNEQAAMMKAFPTQG